MSRTDVLVEALREGPASLPALSRRLAYRASDTLELIHLARAQGIPIRCRRATESGALSTFELVSVEQSGVTSQT